MLRVGGCSWWNFSIGTLLVVSRRLTRRLPADGGPGVRQHPPAQDALRLLRVLARRRHRHAAAHSATTATTAHHGHGTHHLHLLHHRHLLHHHHLRVHHATHASHHATTAHATAAAHAWHHAAHAAHHHHWVAHAHHVAHHHAVHHHGRIRHHVVHHARHLVRVHAHHRRHLVEVHPKGACHLPRIAHHVLHHARVHAHLLHHLGSRSVSASFLLRLLHLPQLRSHVQILLGPLLRPIFVAFLFRSRFVFLNLLLERRSHACASSHTVVALDFNPLVVNHVLGMRVDHLVNSIHIAKLDEGESSRGAIRKALDVNMLDLPELGEVRTYPVFLRGLSKSSNEDNVGVVFLFPSNQLLVLGHL
mmetsp:Transcript_73662/g.191853  ORF Transcript_73662/g.191853 Transcript_73662/m.191853 type:complete len:361 (-) Transcript_73662:45-1127(-)